MRNMETLLQANQKIWFYLKDPVTVAHFVRELDRLQIRYRNASPVIAAGCGAVMAVDKGKWAAHVTLFLWNASFCPDFQERCLRGSAPVMKVDYARYLAGDPDFLCRKNAFLAVF